jgi:hypothetical protein
MDGQALREMPSLILFGSRMRADTQSGQINFELDNVIVVCPNLRRQPVEGEGRGGVGWEREGG